MEDTTPPSEVKPGYQTTEFWKSLAVTITGLSMLGVGVAKERHDLIYTGGSMAGVTASVYSFCRGKAKSAAVVILLCLCAGLGGCITSGTQPIDPKVQQIIAVGGLLVLDVDAIRQGGATQAEKDALERDVNKAIALVGIDSTVGIELGHLLSEYAATGTFPADSWKSAVRLLLEWAAQPAPVVTPAK